MEKEFNKLYLILLLSDFGVYFSLVQFNPEMSIRKHIEWDGKNFHGFVNMGTNINDDSLPVAKDFLVFMVVAVNGHWKMPVGYFMVDGLNSGQQSNLVCQCLKLLHDVGVKMVALTCDGLSANISMLNQLGCSIDVTNLQTTFTAPNTSQKVSAFLDPCHMLKLVRNTLGDKKTIFDNQNEMVNWDYIKRLQHLQVDEGLHLGNKLTAAHVNFKKQIMKVSLAAQIFSSSVANAIEFCCKTLKLPEFEGSEETVRFIRNFNNLFDVLNSRNMKMPGFKKALNAENKENSFTFLDKMLHYINGLKISQNGDLILNSPRKTGFLGFLICIQSTKNLYLDLVEEINGIESVKPLKYLPLYKISQDHLELFFSCVRFHGGFNNNPTAKQFAAAYKKLLKNRN